MMAPNSASMPASARITSAAALQSRRANASSVRRSIEIARSAAWRTSTTGGASTPPRSWMFFAMRAIFCASSPMRSRSVTVLMIAMISRRSLAAGWRLTITWLQSPSSATSMAFTRWSVAMTSSSVARSPELKPSSARRICDSTSPPISSTRERIDSSSASNFLERCSLTAMPVVIMTRVGAAYDRSMTERAHAVTKRQHCDPSLRHAFIHPRRLIAMLRRLVGAAAVAACMTPALAVDITGAGATFPYPVYAKWADAYKKETGVGMNYQSIGSGGGIKQISAKTVDFGASDAPLKGDELTKEGLVQFPMVMGGIVPVVNLDGVKAGDLVLDGPTLA